MTAQEATVAETDGNGAALRRPIDLRSDTVTKPTQEMREAMFAAEVGDDVYGEDPTVRKLEELAAEMVGKEAALFVVSGTMGNQVAVLTHTAPGDEIVLEAESHIYYYEVGAVAALSGVQARTVRGVRGIMDPAAVEEAIREENIHYPRTSLIALENTHNRAGGTVLPLDNMAAIAEVAHRHGVSVHLDGARVFNAAIALGVDAREITKHVDTVQFCLSKGLAAPVGSILAGPREFIERARKKRKMVGGGMRQAGVIAAAGIVALTKMVDRLSEDHANARVLAEGLAGIDGISVDLGTVQTNIVVFDTRDLGVTAEEFVARLKDRGVLSSGFGKTRIRLVTHKDVSREDVLEALEVVKAVAAEIRG